jgi:hypothetical protein
MTMTKKAIRSTLVPMSKALLKGAPTQRLEFLGLKIECSRLYKAPGQIGYAWHPHFAALDPNINAPIGRIVHGGNLSEITDQLYSRSVMLTESGSAN